MKTKNKPAFSLVEIMIAMTIFAMLAVMTVQVFNNTSRMSRKIEIQEYVFTEAEAALSKILREVERSTIDYEEYYSKLVLGSTYYGQNYGAYGATFYDPGTGGPLGLPILGGGDGITGADCVDDDEYFIGMDCEDFILNTYDTNIGEHHLGAEQANAFCEGCDLGAKYSVQDELYLINGAGSRKVIFALEEKEDGERVISMLEMVGYDDEDGDGVMDFWGCSEDYVCNQDVLHGYDVPKEDNDLEMGPIDDGEFEPVTPGNLNIVDLTFFVAPLEDPYRAFAEGEDVIQQYPHVVVVMTVAPSAGLTQGLLGEDWTLTIQGVASANVFGVVPSEYRGGWRW